MPVTATLPRAGTPDLMGVHCLKILQLDFIIAQCSTFIAVQKSGFCKLAPIMSIAEPSVTECYTLFS